MGDNLKLVAGMELNMLNYKRDLDRITKKYTGLSYDDVTEVDVNKMPFKVLCRQLHQSQLKMTLLEPNTSVDFGEQSLRAQDTSDTQQWDNTLQESEADETDVSSNPSAQHEGVSGINNTQLSQSFLDETQGCLDETQESQPEDQDEELENTLSSHGTSLVELYPRMIDQVSKAWHSQRIFETADSVLRKYRRQRFPPNRSHLNHTLDVSVRACDLRNPKKNKGKVVRKRSPNRSFLMNLTPGKKTETVNQSYLHDINNHQDQQTEIGCCTKKANPVESDKYRPAVLMKPSFVTKILQRQQHPEPTESQHQRDQPTGLAISPIRSGHLTIDRFRNQSPRSGREGLRPLLTSNTDVQSLTVTDSSAVCSSPVRQSPFKTWLRNLERQSGMSHALSQSPKSDTTGRHLGESRSASPLSSPQKYSKHLGESRSASPLSSPQKYSKHLGESRSRSASPLSSPQKSIMKHHYYSPSQSKVNSCQSPYRIHKSDTAQSHCRHPVFTRSRSESPHRFSDSPSQSKIYSRQSTSSIPYSPKKIDMEFQRVYHRLVCQVKPVRFAAPPCSVCARHMEANRAMAALALSPHRSLLRKRHRELDSESSRSNKRSRGRCDVNSPGSLRHLRENLKSSSSRRLYSTGPEASSDYHTYSHSQATMAQSPGPQERLMTGCWSAST